MSTGITVTSICNSALGKIGSEFIASLSDTTKAARYCNEQWPKIRNEVLEAHDWNFAIRRAQLGLLATPPLFDFSNQFQLPTDCLRVLKIKDKYDFKIEGRSLLTDASAVMIKYIAEITTPDLYTASFCETAALRLAADLAYAMTQNSSLQQGMYSAYKAKLSEARSYSSQEGTTDDTDASDWFDVRY